MPLLADKERARAIVKLAADGCRKGDHYTREWFLRDENGTWEKHAAEFLERTRTDPRLSAQIAEKGLTAEQVDNEIALELRLMSLTAQLGSAKKGRARVR